ncbi:MAG: AAA family ATPase [Lachnospiraceae bacterium]|nr:AAA family ATPase [Lachnospiraceae bacterium]
MKLTHCSIYQFGKLKEKTFSFSEGINLVQGKNESGKSTLHAALAALLFGAEKGRGRSPRDSIYRNHIPWSDPQLYGGSLDWEREGRQFHVERDFAKTPSRSLITEILPEGSRERTAAELPWPDSLSPYLYFNTLSFKQQGTAVEGALREELCRHIINLQGSGSENLDVNAALRRLREQRRLLQKQQDPRAEERHAQLRRQLEEAQRESFPGKEDSWDEEKTRLAEREEEARRISEERSLLSRELQQRRALLEARGLSDKEGVRRDLEKAEIIAGALENYESSYAPHQPAPWLTRLLSYLPLPFMLFFFWLVVNSVQTRRYLPAGLSVMGFFVFLFISIRYSRKQDAYDSQKQNRKALLQLLAKYLPDYEAEGSVREAAELKEYLGKVSKTIEYLEEKDEAVKEKTENLARILGENQTIGRSLEEDLSRRMARERWEGRISALMDEAEALEAARERNREIGEEIRALDLAIKTLEDLTVHSADEFGEPLTRTASEIFREITGGRYQGIRITPQLELFAQQDHRLIPPEALSAGTMEQLYFSYRMALIRLLWPGEDMPLFFDDSFAFYDDERLGALLKWLHENYGGQVLLFSCQPREEALLKAGQIPFHSLLLE